MAKQAQQKQEKEPVKSLATSDVLHGRYQRGPDGTLWLWDYARRVWVEVK